MSDQQILIRPAGPADRDQVWPLARDLATSYVPVYRASPAPDVQYFGPYLGGVRTRQAIAALYRIRPGAGPGPAARGAHQDLIRARGGRRPGKPAAREADLDDVPAILAKDPAAVARARTELTAIRDRAAQNLAFEFAAKVQAAAEPSLAATPAAWAAFAVRNAELAATLTCG